MTKLILALVAVTFTSPAYAGKAKRQISSAPHACAQDAIKRADKLLRFHFELESPENFGIDDKAEALPPIKNPSGKGKFDVLEVTGGIYKATYRMRFIYAQIKEECVLMGQEVLELSNPY